MKVMRPGRTLRAATALTVALAIAPAAAAQAKGGPPPGDAVAGKATFAARCAMCHGAEGRGGAIGPALRGVYGAQAASQPGQKYSEALKRARPRWTATSLDAFLTKPQGLVPGTAMMATTPNPETRRDLIAYLATLRK